MSYTYQGTSEINQTCPQPPYNTLNFTPANVPVWSTLSSYASTQPQYPLPSGSGSDQVRALQQNVTFFTSLNQQTQAIKTQNTTLGPAGNIPYPTFRSEAERLMYRQGLVMTASRNQMTGRNPSTPAGVPCSTIYEIIQS
jgi:hypothetical protein